MKTIRFVLLVAFLQNFSAVFAQAPEVDIKKLELTTSPAYVLLGVQPTNIIRPSTPRDFATGLQYLNINGVIQPGFALEVNPFNWGKKEDKNKTNSFIANDYFDKRALPAIKKNLSLSLATSATDTTVFGSLDKGTGLGFGIRATIVPGTVYKPTYDNFYQWASAELKSAFLDNLEFLIDDLKDNDDPNQYLSRAKDQAEVWLDQTQHIPEGMKKDLLKELDLYVKEYSMFTKKSDLNAFTRKEKGELTDQKVAAAMNIDKLRTPFAREGFILEVAFSGLFVMQDNKWGNTVYAKTGIWITPSYRLDMSKSDKPKLVQSFDFLGIIRYLWNEERVDNGNYTDFGLKLQFNRNNWNSSLEGLARHASRVPEGVASNWTYSWIMNFTYLITGDISFKFSVGSNFDGNTINYSKPNGVIVSGGLNFGILN